MMSILQLVDEPVEDYVDGFTYPVAIGSLLASETAKTCCCG